MGWVAYGYMEFVRCNDPKPRIPEFPPKLVPYNRYLYGCRRFWSVLDGVNHAGGGGEQHRDDEDWNHRPGQFDLRAPIHLRRLSICLCPSAAELHHGVTQQTGDHQKNQSSDSEDEVRQMTNRLRRR